MKSDEDFDKEFSKKYYNDQPFLSIFYATEKMVRDWDERHYCPHGKTPGWYWTFLKYANTEPFEPHGPFGSVEEATRDFLTTRKG